MMKWISGGRLAFVIVAALTVQACAYGPKAERKNPLNYLSGDHYDTPETGPDSPVIPVVKRIDKLTKVSGNVLSKQGIVDVPLKNVPIGIYNDKGDKVQEISSDIAGQFQFSTVLKNGHYVIRPVSTKYRGELKIEVTSYEIKNLKLILEPTRM